MNKFIEESFKRCTFNGLDSETTYPQISVSDKDLTQLKTRNKMLIYAFNKSCAEIVEKLNEEVYFILADTNGVLLSYDSKDEYKKHFDSFGMYEGISFSEESLGTNSISLAMTSGFPTYLMPKEHYCKAFHKWYCYCLVLKHNGNTIGYLDISTIDIILKDEIKIIGDLLAYKIESQMNLAKSSNDSTSKIEELTDRQKELIYMLLKGYSEKEIASKMFISTSTVKYHKSKVFETFAVKNTAQLTKKYYGLV